MRRATYVSIGELDTPIYVERKAESTDAEYVVPDTSYGTERVVWVPLVRRQDNPLLPVIFFANVQDGLPSRSESVLQGLVVARNQSRIRMPWRDDIDSSMRIVNASTLDIYQIIGGPAVLGRRQGLEIQCERYGSLAPAVEDTDVLLLDDGEPLLLDLEDFLALMTESDSSLLLDAGDTLALDDGEILVLV